MAVKIPTDRNGGRIPNDRSPAEAAASCYYCGRQYDAANKATNCEKRHESQDR